MTTSREIGNLGEEIAARFLEAKGYVVMERQYRFERAEIDLVCFQPSADDTGGEIVFVEVKARSGVGFGSPTESISPAKIRHVVHAATAFLYEHRLDGSPCRFDVVSVMLVGKDVDSPLHDVEHFEAAFTASDGEAPG